MSARPTLEERKERLRRGARIHRWQTAVGVAIALLVYATWSAWKLGGPIFGAALGALTLATVAIAVRLERAYRRLAAEPGRWRQRELIADNHDEIPWEIRLLLRIRRWP